MSNAAIGCRGSEDRPWTLIVDGDFSSVTDMVEAAVDPGRHVRFAGVEMPTEDELAMTIASTIELLTDVSPPEFVGRVLAVQVLRMLGYEIEVGYGGETT